MSVVFANKRLNQQFAFLRHKHTGTACLKLLLLLAHRYLFEAATASTNATTDVDEQSNQQIGCYYTGIHPYRTTSRNHTGHGRGGLRTGSKPRNRVLRRVSVRRQSEHTRAARHLLAYPRVDDDISVRSLEGETGGI